MGTDEQREQRDGQRKRGLGLEDVATQSAAISAILADVLPTLRSDVMAGVDASFNRLSGQMPEMVSRYDSGVQS